MLTPIWGTNITKVSAESSSLSTSPCWSLFSLTAEATLSPSPGKRTNAGIHTYFFHLYSGVEIRPLLKQMYIIVRDNALCCGVLQCVMLYFGAEHHDEFDNTCLLVILRFAAAQFL
jgi:hypothetical protein